MMGKIKNGAMDSVVLYLNSKPFGGGNFQYDLTLLDAFLSLEKKDKHIVYSSEEWKSFLPEGIPTTFVAVSRTGMRFVQILVMIGFPLVVVRLFSRMFQVVRLLEHLRSSLYLFPSQETNLSYLAGVPSLAAIHDLMHRYERRFPEVTGRGRFRYRERHFAAICKNAKGILVDSLCGKQQVMESYGTSEMKIFPLPFVPPKYLYSTEATDFDIKYILPEKYIFYPAQFWFHKNHRHLILAIHELIGDLPDINLVLVGSKKNAYPELLKLIQELGLEERIHFMGYVPNEYLPEFYRRARALVMPSFLGPTNIPPIEAFALGCPVAVSNVYGIPEQVGDAALLFDPDSVEEIAASIKRLWIDDDLCQELSAKGFAKSKLWGQHQFNLKFQEIVASLMSK